MDTWAFLDDTGIIADIPRLLIVCNIDPMLNRRILIATAAAALADPAWGEGSADADLQVRLDEVQAILKPATPENLAAAARLVVLDPAGLSPVRRREYEVVLAGLRREAGVTDYAGRLALAFGSPIPVRDAERRALAEIRVLQTRADRLLRAQGLAKGSVGERLAALAQDPRHLFPDTTAGRDQAVAEMNRRLAAIRPRLARAFGDLPIAAAEVRRMSPADEVAGRAGYREPPTGEQPGVYYVDLKNIRARPAWTLPGVVHHELIPGHLLQILLQARARPHPLRLRYAAAYFEGWAIYAERLAGELGAYDGDPLAELGAIQWRLFRTARIVADIGLNSRGWSADQARAMLAELQGFPAAFIGFEDDVSRMSQSPGKVAAEGLGALEFVRLREAARARAGAHFDITRFHRSVLLQGAWPFGELARVIGA